MKITTEWLDRFNQKWRANEQTGCWEWIGAQTPKGYGFMKIPKTRRQEYAHRVSYMAFNGKVPEGRHVLHRCDNPPCVNPAHLFLGDHHDNHMDMKAKGRHLYGERNTEAVLTEVSVRKIKELLATGEAQSKIALLFGVCQMTISRINTGKRWSHVK